MDAQVIRARSGRGATISGISYGIFAYNEAALLPAAVEAALRAARSVSVPVEITLVVSESEDGTEEIARGFERRHPQVRVVELERKGKVHAVLHFLEREARHEVAVIAGADVRPLPGSLHALLEPFGDERVGMAGPRVVPVPRQGRVPAMHRVLWEAHHQANMLGFRKLGELVVVRRSALAFAPVAGCDEAIIEAALEHAGYERAYVPEAIVENHSPTSLREYLAHRRRIHCMHLAMACTLGQRPATASFVVSARALVRVVRRRPLLVPVAVLTAIAEALGRWMGHLDASRGETAVLWEPSASARLEKVEVA